MADEITVVNLTIDGEAVEARPGMNLIEAAALIGVEIPHFCYHPCLPISGNCRMCQVEVVGAPKLMAACHAKVSEGMQVLTHRSSQKVRDAQASVLEFLLANHPLDCAICDQAGHCKLQDTYMEYSCRPSRFKETKDKKGKAQILGDHIIYDAERCIKCTRCIRFCNEITKTGELGMLGRGARSAVGIVKGHELNNPLSGNVAELCPVGALTHKDFRFKSRDWFAVHRNTICPSCSKGCNCSIDTRGRTVVGVHNRGNEWMCDNGRYGTDKFIATKPLTKAYLNGEEASVDAALNVAAEALSKPVAVFFAPHLSLETFYIWKKLLDVKAKNYVAAVAYSERELSDLEKKFVAPDNAANYKSAQFCGLIGEDPKKHYQYLMERVKKRIYNSIIFVGDGSILAEDYDETFVNILHSATERVAFISDATSPLMKDCNAVLPGRGFFEKSGMLINQDWRLQYAESVLEPLDGTAPEWGYAVALFQDPELSNAMKNEGLSEYILQNEARLRGVTLNEIKNGGVLGNDE